MNELTSREAGRKSSRARSLWVCTCVTVAALASCLLAPPSLSAQGPTFGGFKAGLSYGNISAGGTTAANQVSVVKGHFRGPGNPLDLAVADAANENVEIWFGNGDGTFQRPTGAQIYPLPLLTSLYPTAPPGAVEPTVISTTGNTQIAAADLSGTNSGYDDVVLANFQGPGTITLLKNNHSAGTFTASLIPAVINNNNYITNRGGSISIAIGDFNGDGFLDLAVGNANGNYANPASATGTISVVLNNCGGAYSFCVPVTYNAGIQTIGIAATPLRGSNTTFEDIVATDGASVYVLLNNEVTGTTGNFPSSPSQTIAINKNTLQAITGLITVDVNNDGDPDVIVEDQFGDNSVLVNEGGSNAGILGAPTASLPVTFAAVAGTFNNGSAYPGLVLMTSGGIEYLPNNFGAFGIPVVIGPYTPAFQVGAALTAGAFDSNNNNSLDVVAVNGKEIHVVLGNGDGSFETAPSYLESGADVAEITSNSSTSITAVAVGNLHGGANGAMDTVTADFGSADTLHPNAISSVIVRLANPDGTFPASGTQVIYQSSGTEPNFNSIVLGNFGGAGLKSGGSGAMDIAAVTNFGEIYVFQNDGSGNFTLMTTSPIATGFDLAGAVAGDFRGHGGAPTDIAAIGPATNANNFNNIPQSGSVVVILGNGDGTFVQNGQSGYGSSYQGTVNTPTSLTTFVNPAQLAVGSLGGSSYPDIVIADSGENYPTPAGGGVWVLRNDGTGDGLFNATPLQISSTSVQCCASQPYGPSSVALGKIFGSSFLDIVSASAPGAGQFLNVFQNSGNYTFPITPAATYALGGQLAIADVNQDGTPDVVLWSDMVQVLLNTRGTAAASILQPWDPSFTAGPAPFLSLTGPQPPLLGVGYLPNSMVPNVLVSDAQPALDVLLNLGAGASAPTPMPFAQFSASQLNLGNAFENTPVTQTITLTNTGSGPLTIPLVTVSVPNAPLGTSNGFSYTQIVCQGFPVTVPVTLNSGQTCIFTIQLDPTTTGPLSAQLAFADNAGPGESNLSVTSLGNGFYEQDITLSGNGEPPLPPFAQFTASQLNFGGVTENSPQTQTVTISNQGYGNGPLVISSAGILQPSSNPYSILNDCNGATLFPVTINAGQQCTFTFQFDPTVPGTLNATVNFLDNAPQANLTSSVQTGSLYVQQVSLTGTGLAPCAPDLTGISINTTGFEPNPRQPGTYSLGVTVSSAVPGHNLFTTLVVILEGVNGSVEALSSGTFSGVTGPSGFISTTFPCAADVAGSPYFLIPAYAVTQYGGEVGVPSVTTSFIITVPRGQAPSLSRVRVVDASANGVF